MSLKRKKQTKRRNKMGYGNCGTDSQGRPIGYNHQATCDEEGCEEKIDRGMAYACGGTHGSDCCCEKYFCGKHLYSVDLSKTSLAEVNDGPICAECKEDLEEEYYIDFDACYRPREVEITAENLEEYREVYQNLFDVLSPPLTEEETERMNTIKVALDKYNTVKFS
jgi:hypothetical protein